MSSTVQNHIKLPNSETIQEASAILNRGGLVALPTETVYGLGADAENQEALARLYQIKGRPGSHPVIVHIGAVEQLSEWAREISDEAWQLAITFWPGPLTLILPRTSRVSDAVTGGQDTVGIRIPSHPVALELLNAFDGGIAAPSANRFGRLSPTSAQHVYADLGQDVDLILDGGPCNVGVESTIVAFPDGRPVILRPGMITAVQIENTLNQKLAQPSNIAEKSVIRAPGTLSSHYAPHTPLYYLSADEIRHVISSGKYQSIGVLARTFQPQILPDSIQWIQAPLNAQQYAQMLYGHLRAFDQMDLDAILVELLPSDEGWAASHDRLKRAAFQRNNEERTQNLPE